MIGQQGIRAMNEFAGVSDAALDKLQTARTQNKWKPTAVTTEQLFAIYNLMKLGPTSANCSPARFVFVATAEAKKRLARCASLTNAAKILEAPISVIIASDLAFALHLPKLFPHDPTAPTWFADCLGRDNSISEQLSPRRVFYHCGPCHRTGLRTHVRF
jgi:3-hydroxypropanoate dehydrogenase